MSNKVNNLKKRMRVLGEQHASKVRMLNLQIERQRQLLERLTADVEKLEKMLLTPDQSKQAGIVLYARPVGEPPREQFGFQLLVDAGQLRLMMGRHFRNNLASIDGVAMEVSHDIEGRVYPFIRRFAQAMLTGGPLV